MGLVAVVGTISTVLAVGLVVLWPPHGAHLEVSAVASGPGMSIRSVEVTAVKPQTCSSSDTPDGLPGVSGPCAAVTVRQADGSLVEVEVPPAVFRAGIRPGDRVRMARLDAPDGGGVSYQFLDFQRTGPLLLLAAGCLGLLVLVTRWRGLLAVVGVAGTVAMLIGFMLPALLAGRSPLAVAVVGSGAVMVVLLYLVHGVSVRTTCALLGTLAGIAVTAFVSIYATGWTHLTGLGTEDDQTLMAVAGQVRLSTVVAASMVIAGLGVLNDITVTQASAVEELRAADPEQSRTACFRAAMRIGRDHVASSVYTLVFAYAGSALTLLLLIKAYAQSLAAVAVTDDVATEIVRTLVGLVGVSISVPLTTAIAVALVPRPALPREKPALPDTAPTRDRLAVSSALS